MCEERGEVADWLLGVVGHDDGVESSSHSWPAVTVSWRQTAVLLPPQHLETERPLEVKHVAAGRQNIYMGCAGILKVD